MYRSDEDEAITASEARAIADRNPGDPVERERFRDIIKAVKYYSSFGHHSCDPFFFNTYKLTDSVISAIEELGFNIQETKLPPEKLSENDLKNDKAYWYVVSW